MLHSDYELQNCSMSRALEVVGERWTLLIVRDLLVRPCRFADLERHLGVSKNILATRLGKLVARGVVEKVPYSKTREWSEYRLTEKGRGLFYVVSALTAWGDDHEAPDGPPVVIKHSCGEPAGHHLQCAHCGNEVTPRNIHSVAGPGHLLAT